MNCSTIIQFEGDVVQIALQNVVMGILTIYVIGINITTIWLTVVGETSPVPTAKVFVFLTFSSTLSLRTLRLTTTTDEVKKRK